MQRFRCCARRFVTTLHAGLFEALHQLRSVPNFQTACPGGLSEGYAGHVQSGLLVIAFHVSSLGNFALNVEKFKSVFRHIDLTRLGGPELSYRLISILRFVSSRPLSAL